MPELPESLEELKPFAEDLKKLVSAVRDPSILKKFAQGGRPKQITPNKNFAKDEFKEIWHRINHKAAYTVDFSSEELVKKSIEALNHAASSLPAIRRRTGNEDVAPPAWTIFIRATRTLPLPCASRLG